MVSGEALLALLKRLQRFKRTTANQVKKSNMSASRPPPPRTAAACCPPINTYVTRCSTGSSHQPSGSSHQPSGAQGLSVSNQQRSCCRCSRCSCMDASRDGAQQPRFFCFICISKQVTCARAAVTQARRADASQLLCWQTQKRLLLTQSRTSSGSGLISVLLSYFSTLPLTTEVRSARKTRSNRSNTPYGAAASWQRNTCIPMKSHPT